MGRRGRWWRGPRWWEPLVEGEARKIRGHLSKVGKVRLGPYDIGDKVCGTVLLEFCKPVKRGKLIS